MRLHKNILACSGVSIASCATHLYGAIGVFGIFSDFVVIPAWPWWVFQTAMRLEEITMCILVFMLAGKAKTVIEDANQRRKGLHRLIHSAIEKLQAKGLHRRKRIAPLASAGANPPLFPSGDAKHAWPKASNVTSCGDGTVGEDTMTQVHE